LTVEVGNNKLIQNCIMKNKEAQEIYDLLDTFIQVCIIKNDSLITDQKELFTLVATNEAVEKYVENPDVGTGDFEEKTMKQFKGASRESKIVFAHAIWLWGMAPQDFVRSSKMHFPKFILEDGINLNEEAFPHKGFGSAGPGLNFHKGYEVMFCVKLIQVLKKKQEQKALKNADQGRKWIEYYVLKHLYNEDQKGYEFSEADLLKINRSLAMYNILLHLSNPDLYERIVSGGHKDNILASFDGLLEDEDESISDANREVKIHRIREIISEAIQEPEFDFYDRRLRHIWDSSKSGNDFSDIEALKFKKAIILYGPPGTSKTYYARQLAQSIVFQKHFSNKENLKDLGDQADITKDKIHSLQLHPNYSYEDFIAGIQIKDNKTVPVKGDFLKILEKAEDDPYPHVIILDEINRVDLSRLFGELFSAMENRNESINLSLGDFKISVPENIYFIGTMNEIDFSLERLDFALRRRFVWSFYGFDNYILRSILNEKMNDRKIHLYPNDIERFVTNATKLNYEIGNMEELGREYEIGHTFFGEIVEIFESFKKLRNRARNFSIYVDEGPAYILWEISIKPIINAFLGNMDKKSREEKLEQLETVYLAE